MAGGEGSRLRPLTSHVPKPMMPLVNRPMMEHVVRLLARHGIDEIVVTLAYLSNQIRTYFGDGSEFGVSMAYASEEQPLGTAGSVRNAMAELDERFLVISGDILTDVDLTALVAFHDHHGALATIGLTAVENPLDFGIVITDDQGRVERFQEKPSWGDVFSDNASAGIFVLEPAIFDHIAPDRAVDFSSEVFPALLDAGEALYGSVLDGYWEDVGTLEAYRSAHLDVLDAKVDIEVPGFAQRDDVWVGEGVDVHQGAVIDGPAVIGDYCRIEDGAHLGRYTVLGTNVRVRAGADLERVVVHDNAYLGEGVQLRGTVAGRAADVRRHARCDEGAVLGDECFVGEAAVIGSEVKVYPSKSVEAGAVVHSSVVWESRGTRSLFGRQGVVGLANVDITPEVAARVAMAYGTTLKAGDLVVTSRDSSRSARMLKRAMMAGFNAVGINVLDLEVASMPLTRFQARRPRVAGGVSLRLDRDDSQSVAIRFFDVDGADLGEQKQRKIERQLVREDFRRVLAGDIGDISFPPRALEHYTSALEASVDTTAIRAAQFKLVVDYSFGTTSFVMPQVLGKLGADVLAVNPYASTGRMIALDHEAAVANVARLVEASGADLGAILDPDGEALTLVDDRGRVLSNLQALLAGAAIVAPRIPGCEIAVPVNVTSAIDAVVGEDVTVIRTKLSRAELMAASRDAQVAWAGTEWGEFVVGATGPSFDAAATLVHLLDWLTADSRTLAEVVDRLPPSNVVHRTVATPWEQKGAVMRALMEQSHGQRAELVDGVKLFDGDEWVLALPDPVEAVTHLWAEAGDARTSTARVDAFAQRIRHLLR